MASPSGTTNQETPLPSMSFVFPPYGDVGPPLMARGLHLVNLSHSTCDHGTLNNTLNFQIY